MSKLDINIQYKFLNVGQGLFTTGKINIRKNSSNRVFNWVYDCGSTNQENIDSALKCEFSKCDEIDIVFISHFDKDHINGLVELLKTVKKVKNLVLPYYPMWKRILIGLEYNKRNKIIDLEDFSFFMNPIKFLTKIGTIDQFVFVDENYVSKEFSTEIENNNLENLPEVPENFKIETEPLDEILNSELNSKYGKLKSGTNITLPKIYEFIPYQDKTVCVKKFKRFQDMVSKIESNLLSQDNKTVLKQNIAELKNIYKKKFGKSAKEKNIISLFLMGIPLINTSNNPHLIGFDVYVRNRIQTKYNCFYYNTLSKDYILFTGDGFLNTSTRLNNLKRHFNDNRLRKISVFQVMHHGSKNNFNKLINKHINPDFSIFSSDPLIRPFHPNAEVVKHFIYNNPIQVDNSNFCVFNFYYYIF